MRAVKVMTLSEYRSGTVARIGNPPQFPPYGQTDLDIFENNLLEVMQFVFNHTTFDANDEIDQKLLAAYEPLGVAPGRAYDPSRVAEIDGARFRAVAERIPPEVMAKLNDPEFLEEFVTSIFQPKGQMTLERLLIQSISGPIG